MMTMPGLEGREVLSGHCSRGHGRRCTPVRDGILRRCEVEKNQKFELTWIGKEKQVKIELYEIQ